MVYVSSQVLSLAPRTAVLNAQSELTKAQAELASGKLSDVGLALGGRSGQVISMAAQSAHLQGYIDTNTIATARLKSTTAILDNLQSTASAFLATLATSDPSSPSFPTVSLSAANGLDAMISGLNTSVGGQAIFGGINTDTAPLTTYEGSPAQTAVRDSFTSTFGFPPSSPSAATVSAADMKSYLDTQFASLFSASSFSSTWSQASDQTVTTQISDDVTLPTSVSANENAFRVLAQAYTMMREFGTGPLGTAAKGAAVTAATSLLGKAGDGLIDLNANTGLTLSAMTDASDRQSTQKSLLDTQVASLQGVDTYALTTRLSALQTQVQASFELTSELRKLSLVNYLS